MSCPFLFGQSRSGQTSIANFGDLQSAIKTANEAESESAKTIVLYLTSYGIEDANAKITIDKGVNVTLDLNGRNLWSNADNYLFQINEGATLRIKNTGNYGEGSIKAKGINNYQGTLIIENVVCVSESTSGALINNQKGGTVNINGGSYVTKSNTAINNQGVMTIANAEISSDYRAITVYKESTLDITNTKIYDVNAGYRFDAKYLTAAEVNLAYTNTERLDDSGNAIPVITEGEGTFFVKAIVGDEPFASLKEAVESAIASQENEVSLYTSDVEDEIIEITAPIIINGNNKTLTSTASRAINVNIDGFETNNEVTINDLTIVGKDGCQRGINIIRTNEVTEPGSPIVNINNVTISDMTHYAVHVAKTGAAVKVNVKDSNLSAWGALAVYGDGTICNVENSKLTGINTYQGESDAFATIALGGKNVEINVDENSTVTAKSSDEYKTQFIVCIYNSTTENAKVVLKTNNLSLEGSNVEYLESDFSNSNIDLQVSKDLIETLEEAGYALGTPTEDGLVSVEGVAVAEIDGKNYTSLQAALNAVAEDGIIKIVAAEGEEDYVKYNGTAKRFTVQLAESSNYTVKGFDVESETTVTIEGSNYNSFGVKNANSVIEIAGEINTATINGDGSINLLDGAKFSVKNISANINASGNVVINQSAGSTVTKPITLKGATLAEGTVLNNVDIVVAEGENAINTAIELNNLTVADEATLTANANVTVNNVLEINGTVEVDNNAKLSHNKSLTKLNDGAIIKVAEGSTFAIFSGDFNGKVKFEINGTAKSAYSISTLDEGDKLEVELKAEAARFEVKEIASDNFTITSGVAAMKVAYQSEAYVLANYEYVAQVKDAEGVVIAKFESVADALDKVEANQTIVIEGKEGDKEPAVISYDGEGKTFTITSAEGSMYSFGGNKINLSNATVNLDNANINGIIVAAKDATINIIGTTYVKTLMSAGTGKYLVDNATLNVGTLMSDVYVSGVSTLKVDAYTSGTLFMSNVTLGETSVLNNANITFTEGDNVINGQELGASKYIINNGVTVTLNNAMLEGVDNSTIEGTLNVNNSQVKYKNLVVNGELNITNEDNANTVNELEVTGTLTGNGMIKLNNVDAKTKALIVNNTLVVDKNSVLTILTTIKGDGTLEIAGNVNASESTSQTVENITINSILLNGTAAKFYAPEGLTNVKDVNDLLEPKYEEEEGYYSLDGTYVAQVGEKSYLTIGSALEAVQENNTIITLIDNTTEDVTIGKNVEFETIESGVAINGTVTIGDGVNLTNHGKITVNGSLNNNGTLTNNGALIVNALNGVGSLTNNATFNNNGTLTANVIFENTDKFINYQTIEASELINSGDIENKTNAKIDVLVESESTDWYGNSTTTFSGSIANTGTINNYGSLQTNEFTYNSNVYLYANSSVWVQQTNDIPGSFFVNAALTLDANTQLQKANITFVKDVVSTINGANLAGSKLTVEPDATLNVQNNLNIESLDLKYETGYYWNEYVYVYSTVNIKGNGNLTVSTLTNNAKLNVEGTLKTTTLTNESRGTIINTGTLTANTNGIENKGTLTNNGTLTATTITNSGSISNDAGKSLTVNGTLTNNLTINNSGSLTAYNVLNNSNNTVNTNIQLENISNGTLTVNNGDLTNNGSITISSNSNNNKVTGTLTNKGTITVSHGAKLTANTVSNEGAAAKLNVYGNFVANSSSYYYNSYSFTNVNGATINVTGSLQVNSNNVKNNGTVNVEGTSAVIYIANSVSSQSTGTFNMEGVNLNGSNKLTGADIKFTGVTYPYAESSTISGATLTNSKLTVDSGYILDVTANLDLSDGTLTNNGTVNVDRIELSGATLTNSGTLSINESGSAIFSTVENNYIINVSESTLEATSTFTNSGTVNVEDSSVLNATVTGDGTFNMTNVILDGNTTLTSANITFTKSNNTVRSSYLLGSAVIVESGATLELTGATTGGIINKGTLNLTGIVEAGDVTNMATIGMMADDTKFYTPTETLADVMITCHTGDDVVYNVDEKYYYINNNYVAKVGEKEYALLQDAIDAANNGIVTIIAESIEENVKVSDDANIEFKLDAVSEATINGTLTVAGKATFNCAKIQFTNVDLEAGAKMDINSGAFSVEGTIATLGQNTAIYVAEETELNGRIKIQHLYTSIDIDGTVDASSVTVPEVINVYTINLGAHDAKLITPTTGLNVTTNYVAEDLIDENGKNHRVSYKEDEGWYQLVNMFVAKIGVNGTTPYTTLDAALQAANNNEEIYLLWEDGNDPIVMKGALSGKNVTIKAAVDATIDVDWSEGWLFIGRGYEYNNGPAELTFDNVTLSSVNNGVHVSNDNTNGYIYGIHVSGRQRNSEKYDGKLVIKNSVIELSYLVNRNVVEIEDNSELTLQQETGLNVGGRVAKESTTGTDRSASIALTNSTLNINNANIGYEDNIDGQKYPTMGVMNVNEGSQVNIADGMKLHVGDQGTLNSSANIFGFFDTTDLGQINLSAGIYSFDVNAYCELGVSAFELPTGYWEIRQTAGGQERKFANAGWYWFSSYIADLEGTEGLNMLRNELNPYGKQIKGQFGFTNYFGSNWSQGGLNALSSSGMYMINTTDAVTVSFEGDFVDYSNTPIVLQKGWNWIGYPVKDAQDLTVALANLTPNEGDVIKGKTWTSYYEDGAWEPIDNIMEPGHGYMYYSVKENDFYYNSNGQPAAPSRASESKYWNANTSLYPSNMSIIATTDIEGSDYEVAAFVDGEVRGSARPIYVESIDAYIVVLTISGNDVEEMTFKYYDTTTGEEFEFANRMNYSNDALVGSMAEPFMLTRGTTGIGNVTANVVNIYPNPTTTDVEINLNATCNKVEVFNALGVKVAEYQNVDSIDALETAGIYVIRITNEGNVQNCRLVVK
ncbi:MAG: hypothetical protein IJZ87_01455 [Bacteroidales bacterium]|nr:hypothetical protein [Bacteroidales bacterium]